MGQELEDSLRHIEELATVLREMGDPQKVLRLEDKVASVASELTVFTIPLVGLNGPFAS
jgi:hypothetical protein